MCSSDLVQSAFLPAIESVRWHSTVDCGSISLCSRAHVRKKGLRVEPGALRNVVASASCTEASGLPVFTSITTAIAGVPCTAVRREKRADGVSARAARAKQIVTPVRHTLKAVFIAFPLPDDRNPEDSMKDGLRMPQSPVLVLHGRRSDYGSLRRLA